MGTITWQEYRASQLAQILTGLHNQIYTYFPHVTLYMRLISEKGSQSSHQSFDEEYIIPNTNFAYLHRNNNSAGSYSHYLIDLDAANSSTFANFILTKSHLELFNTSPNSIETPSDINASAPSANLGVGRFVSGGYAPASSPWISTSEVPSSAYSGNSIGAYSNNVRITHNATEYGASEIINLGFGGQTDEGTGTGNTDDPIADETYTPNPLIAAISSAVASRRKI